MRVRSPSTTLTLTITVSPGSKSGMVLPAESRSACSLLSVWIRFMANSPSAARRSRPRLKGLMSGFGRASTTKPRACHPVRGSRLFGAFGPGPVGRPEVGPALAGQPFGLGLPPGPDLGVVASGQDFGDALALEQGRTGVL